MGKSVYVLAEKVRLNDADLLCVYTEDYQPVTFIDAGEAIRATNNLKRRSLVVCRLEPINVAE